MILTRQEDPLCIICGDRLANEAMKPSKLLWHMETKHPGLKDKPLEFFERKKHEQEGQKPLLRATTSTNASALRASYLVANRIAMGKKPFTIGEDLILPATKDICHEFLGEAAVKKLAQVPISTSTVTRRIEEIAEDIETQLSARINKSSWYTIQVDESTDTGRLSGLTARVKEVAPKCQATHCVVHREILASRKMSPEELNSILNDVI